MERKTYSTHSGVRQPTRCLKCGKMIPKNAPAVCVGFIEEPWNRYVHPGCYKAIGGDNVKLMELLSSVEPVALGSWFNNGGQLT